MATTTDQMCPCGAKPARECPITALSDDDAMMGTDVVSMTFLVFGPYGPIGILDVMLISVPLTTRDHDWRTLADAFGAAPQDYMSGDPRRLTAHPQPVTGFPAVV